MFQFDAVVEVGQVFHEYSHRYLIHLWC